MTSGTERIGLISTNLQECLQDPCLPRLLTKSPNSSDEIKRLRLGVLRLVAAATVCDNSISYIRDEEKEAGVAHQQWKRQHDGENASMVSKLAFF